MRDLRVPLFPARQSTAPLHPPPTVASYLGQNVVVGRRRHDTEADQEDIRLRVRKRTQTIIILLTSGIPKPQANGFPIDHHIRGIIVKASPPLVSIVHSETRAREQGNNLHRGDIFARKRIGSIGNKQARLFSRKTHVSFVDLHPPMKLPSSGSSGDERNAPFQRHRRLSQHTSRSIALASCRSSPSAAAFITFKDRVAIVCLVW